MIDWILADEQRPLYEFLVALAVNLVFLLIVTLIVLPLDRFELARRLAFGYVVFWIALAVTVFLLILGQKILRLGEYSHFNTFVFSNFAHLLVLLAFWSAYAALIASSSGAGAPVWVAVVMYALCFLSCGIASTITGAFYFGTLYRVIALPFALVTFIIFAFWQTGAQCLAGWMP